MALEIEAKIKVENLSPYEERLKLLGARFEGEFTQQDTYFDFPDHRLTATDSGLRLRKMSRGDNAQPLLCFKGPRQAGPYKKRAEYEFEVSDGAAARELLGGLGLRACLEFTKNRRLWRLDGCAVCLDCLPELGCFVEIEGPDESRIEGVLKQLELTGREVLHVGYAQMMAQKQAG